MECKLFFSKRCGYSRKFVENTWKALKESHATINGEQISYQDFEQNSDNTKIFKEYDITGYPTVYMVHNDRKFEAIVGNMSVEQSVDKLKIAVLNLNLDDEKWGAVNSRIEEEKRKKREDRELMRHAYKFIQQPDIKKLLKEFAKNETKSRAAASKAAAAKAQESKDAPAPSQAAASS